MRKRHYVWATLALASLGFVGCDDAPEEGRATIAVTLNGGSPIESDVSDGGIIFEDLISAAFQSRAYNKFITEPRGDVLIEKYRITWERVDGGTGVLSPREETTNFYVPLNGTASGGVRLVTWADKTGPILAPLVGTLNTVEMRCTVEFTAREVGTEAEVKTSVSASVHFADTV